MIYSPETLAAMQRDEDRAEYFDIEVNASLIRHRCPNPKCGKEFTKKRSNKRFCSVRCYHAVIQREVRSGGRVTPKKGVP